MSAAELLSAEYKALLIKKHQQQPWGGDGHVWAPYVCFKAQTLELHEPSILDYGCGRGTLKAALTHLDVREYDPAIPGKDSQPARADVVVCTDVLEHVEPELVDATLESLAALTRAFCLMVISCRAAKELLPDGRNAHLTIEHPLWWLERAAVAFVGFDVSMRTFTLKQAVIEAVRK